MKLLASDYDGTLRQNDVVTKEDIEAIALWRKAGNAFGIVTGRSMESIRKEVEMQGIEIDFVVGNNGGTVYSANFEKLKTYYIDFKKALDIMDYLKRETCISFVVNDGYHRAKVLLDASREDKKYAGFTSAFTIEEAIANKTIAQIVASLDKEEDTMRIANHINGQFANYAIAYRNVNCVDIAPYGISKSTGVSYMVKRMNIRQEDVYTIGDSYNDIPMLETYHGIAISTSPMQVKSYAETTAPSVGACIHRLLKENQ